MPTGTSKLKLNDKKISIQVTFGGNESSAKNLNQLSGGQKSATAIALIFALSRIEPPPFYILDEIDAPLDTVIRGSLTQLIRKMSDQNQFIISSFKEEMIDIADNIYLIKFENKGSKISQIKRKEAKRLSKNLDELTGKPHERGDKGERGEKDSKSYHDSSKPTERESGVFQY